MQDNEAEFETIKVLNGDMIEVKQQLRGSNLQEKMHIPEIEEKLMSIEITVENEQEEFEKKALDIFQKEHSRLQFEDQEATREREAKEDALDAEDMYDSASKEEEVPPPRK